MLGYVVATVTFVSSVAVVGYYVSHYVYKTIYEDSSDTEETPTSNNERDETPFSSDLKLTEKMQQTNTSQNRINKIHEPHANDKIHEGAEEIVGRSKQFIKDARQGNIDIENTANLFVTTIKTEKKIEGKIGNTALKAVLGEGEYKNNKTLGNNVGNLTTSAVTITKSLFSDKPINSDVDQFKKAASNTKTNVLNMLRKKY